MWKTKKTFSNFLPHKKDSLLHLGSASGQYFCWRSSICWKSFWQRLLQLERHCLQAVKDKRLNGIQKHWKVLFPKKAKEIVIWFLLESIKNALRNLSTKVYYIIKRIFCTKRYWKVLGPTKKGSTTTKILIFIPLVRSYKVSKVDKFTTPLVYHSVCVQDNLENFDFYMFCQWMGVTRKQILFTLVRQNMILAYPEVNRMHFFQSNPCTM